MDYSKMTGNRLGSRVMRVKVVCTFYCMYIKPRNLYVCMYAQVLCIGMYAAVESSKLVLSLVNSSVKASYTAAVVLK